MKRFLLLWLLGACLVAIGLGRFNLSSLYPLARRGVETVGTVTGFESDNHRTVHYTFEVNGKMFSGSQEGGVDGKATTPSAKHAVFYLPEDPNTSCIGDPMPMLWNEVISISLVIFILVPVALLGVRMRSPGFRRWLSGGALLPSRETG
jgi:Protein of unknown function (DUF3592)